MWWVLITEVPPDSERIYSSKNAFGIPGINSSSSSRKPQNLPSCSPEVSLTVTGYLANSWSATAMITASWSTSSGTLWHSLMSTLSPSCTSSPPYSISEVALFIKYIIYIVFCQYGHLENKLATLSVQPKNSYFIEIIDTG